LVAACSSFSRTPETGFFLIAVKVPQSVD
jgi:hypothetical protein